MSLLRNPFMSKQRLTKKSEFELLYATGAKRTVGPLYIHKLKNNLEYSRLGLSIPKRVGNAIKRNKLKRLCREAFRQSQHELPIGIDVLLTIRPHATLKLTDYKELIAMGVCSE